MSHFPTPAPELPPVDTTTLSNWLRAIAYELHPFYPTLEDFTRVMEDIAHDAILNNVNGIRGHIVDPSSCPPKEWDALVDRVRDAVVTTARTVATWTWETHGWKPGS